MTTAVARPHVQLSELGPLAVVALASHGPLRMALAAETQQLPLWARPVH